MLRPVRIQYAGAVYHVMYRGDRREAIFADDRDREMFLGRLGQMCARSGLRVHSYVLMSNHYHLLLETPEPNLVAGMKWFQGTYTQRFNARHRLSGHLFQGRYKAIPEQAEADGYSCAASEYIHLNPVRAGLLDRRQPELLDYPECGIEVHERHEKHERPDGCGSCCAHPPGEAEKFRKAFLSCRFVLFVDTPSPLLGLPLEQLSAVCGQSGAAGVAAAGAGVWGAGAAG